MFEKKIVVQIYWFVLNCVQENYHRCNYPQFSKSGWGNSTPNFINDEIFSDGSTLTTSKQIDFYSQFILSILLANVFNNDKPKR